MVVGQIMLIIKKLPCVSFKSVLLLYDSANYIYPWPAGSLVGFAVGAIGGWTRENGLARSCFASCC